MYMYVVLLLTWAEDDLETVLSATTGLHDRAPVVTSQLSPYVDVHLCYKNFYVRALFAAISWFRGK